MHLGGGKASFHNLKKLARKNGKKGGMSKGKRSGPGGRSTSIKSTSKELNVVASQATISNEISCKGTEVGLEPFGVMLGMEWGIREREANQSIKSTCVVVAAKGRSRCKVSN